MQANLKAAVLSVSQALFHPPQQFFRESRTVIIDSNVQFIPRLYGADAKIDLIRSHRMLYTVFYKHLDQKGRYPAPSDSLFDRQAVRKSIAIQYFMNFQIILDTFYFFLQGNRHHSFTKYPS